MAEKKTNYKVTGTDLHHNGVKVTEGGTIELTDAEVAKLKGKKALGLTKVGGKKNGA